MTTKKGKTTPKRVKRITNKTISTKRWRKKPKRGAERQRNKMTKCLLCPVSPLPQNPFMVVGTKYI